MLAQYAQHGDVGKDMHFFLCHLKHVDVLRQRVGKQKNATYIDEKSTWILHDRLWIMFHDLLKFVSDPPQRSRLDANSGTPC